MSKKWKIKDKTAKENEAQEEMEKQFVKNKSIIKRNSNNNEKKNSHITESLDSLFWCAFAV